MQSMYVYIVPFVAGCSYDWTSTAPAPTLVGAPLQPGQYTKLNALPASHSSLVIAADGSPWAGFCEFRGVTGSRGACTRLHLARIDGAPGDELLEGDILFLTNQNVFVIHFGMNGAQSTVTTHDPGDPRADTITPVPSAPPSTAPGATPPTAPL